MHAGKNPIISKEYERNLIELMKNVDSSKAVRRSRPPRAI